MILEKIKIKVITKTFLAMMITNKMKFYQK